MCMPIIILLSGIFLAYPLSVLSLELHPFLADNLVLARAPLSARLWGWGTPGEIITVILDGIEVNGNDETKVDNSGEWVQNLPPREASIGPHTLVISGSDSGTVSIRNVAFGDVFLCSGQSNMQFAVIGAFNASAEIEDSVNYPNLRLATVALVPADEPQIRAKSGSNYTWAVSGPSALSPLSFDPFSWFSATCYFFGRDLYKGLGQRVPIGIIASSWGGQTVETFSSPDAIGDHTCGGTRRISGIFEAALKSRTVGDITDPTLYSKEMTRKLPSTSQLWNGMIYPLIQMRFAGVIWYQGEANAGDPSSYACRFPAMISDWRLKMGLRLPFYFVQLAAYAVNYAEIRNAQMAALKLQDVGYAVAIDLGDPQSPHGSIHPRRKQEVGRRLSLAALGTQYGRDVVMSGPIVRGAVVRTSSHSTVILIEYVPGTADGIHANGTAACQECCSISPFEVMEKSKNNAWVRVGFAINGTRVTLDSSIIDVPLAVRYNWEGYPQCAIYNGEGAADDHLGIAATPFRVNITHYEEI